MGPINLFTFKSGLPGYWRNSKGKWLFCLRIINFVCCKLLIITEEGLYYQEKPIYTDISTGRVTFVAIFEN